MFPGINSATFRFPRGAARMGSDPAHRQRSHPFTRQAAEMGGTTDTAGRRAPARMVLRRAMAPA
jgi:hypothetical protein